MTEREIRALLTKYKQGSMSEQEAVKAICDAPFEDMRYAEVDHAREIRQGFPEVIYGESKTKEQVLGIMQWLIPFLWGLIPIAGIYFGIKKSYSYAMAMYVKVDNPNAEWRECLERSTLLMDGHRWELFCLQFSFIGWILLGALACGIGTLWVIPYMNAATANFYEARRMQGGIL